MTCGWTSPATAAAKVNAGLELGGVPLMTQTVESLLGQKIDHTVMLDFQGFAAMTDALGGVDVDIKQAFQGTIDDHVYFPAGVNRLTGPQALSFVRERKAFGDGDYQRVRNQQTFLKAVMAKMAAEGGLSDRNTVKQLVATVLPHVTVDPGLTVETLERLAFSLRSTAPGNGVFFTLPTAGVGTSRDRPVRHLAEPGCHRRRFRRAVLRHPGRVHRRERAAERQLSRRRTRKAAARVTCPGGRLEP